MTTPRRRRLPRNPTRAELLHDALQDLRFSNPYCFHHIGSFIDMDRFMKLRSRIGVAYSRLQKQPKDATAFSDAMSAIGELRPVFAVMAFQQIVSA